MIVIFHYVNCNMYTMRQWNKSSCSQFARIRHAPILITRHQTSG